MAAAHVMLSICSISTVLLITSPDVIQIAARTHTGVTYRLQGDSEIFASSDVVNSVSRRNRWGHFT